MPLPTQTAIRPYRSPALSVLFALLSLSFASSVPAQSAKTPAANQAPCGAPKETILLVPALSYEVAGTGRLYFHSAPNGQCLLRDTFVIPGNRLVANEEQGNWTWVSYSGKNGNIAEGWVETGRLKFTGTAGHTDPRQAEFYRKAVEAARAGKLGSPFGESP